ncbi:G protein-coupled glucose receptor regulating Gpa2-domain-containing protein [Pseudomassariella vexata]|uniref:G protein-coupled glucose receptor regulating Gpa2-domain-containing protein n=1 Tax=Pseudomassariella vexata TaxID=1141098 RepID=A0A1Y2DQQ1_9PEZI|nr:G protein-coupled glucose receptor regulating Gpa2-domain-containing protein [Pseudomassariella vexata]ORY61618.1 G protein-coupled glucose receptor regulating Gpa2-domain-containing protein [Pseudomassariella vexata]
MAPSDVYAKLAPESDSLIPLPDAHRHGLIAVAVLGMLSFVSCTTLFGYLTYKLVRWQLARSQFDNEDHQDLSLGLSERLYGQAKPRVVTSASATNRNRPRPQKRALNQFLVLVYNLLFADMHQAMAFLLNASWVRSDAIYVGTSTCWAQGWFVSVGDLASSAFISAIAVHTYLSVIKRYKPPQKTLYIAIGCIWFFVYALGFLGIIITRNGWSQGGLYVRARAWCWMNVEYENLRLWLHYFWIFVSLALTSVLYTLIFFSLKWDKPLSHSRASGELQRNLAAAPRSRSGHPPAFLVYPVIYVVCTAPLALGRIVSMAGRNVSIDYFCLAGAMIASNGWLDVVLFSTTRHSIIFNSPDTEDSGLGTFAFMRTPQRRFGNMVWVQGAAGDADPERAGKGRRRARGWWRVGGQGASGGKSGLCGWPSADESGVSQESLRGVGSGMNENAIHMDTVTSVVVEMESDKKRVLLH